MYSPPRLPCLLTTPPALRSGLLWVGRGPTLLNRPVANLLRVAFGSHTNGSRPRCGNLLMMQQTVAEPAVHRHALSRRDECLRCSCLTPTTTLNNGQDLHLTDPCRRQSAQPAAHL